jgi:hypothetical protein
MWNVIFLTLRGPLPTDKGGDTMHGDTFHETYISKWSRHMLIHTLVSAS